MDITRALLITENEEYIQLVRSACQTHGVATTTVGKDWREQNFEVYQYLFIDYELVQAERLSTLFRKKRIIMLLNTPDYRVVRDLLQEGVHDVIHLPEEMERLHEVLETKWGQPMREQEMTELYEEGEHGAVTAFFSAKGGSGTTLLSTLYAQLLQSKLEQRTILIDMNIQFGGVEVLFGFHPQRTYDDLQPVLNELNWTHIRNVTWVDEKTGLAVLFSPNHPEGAEQLPEELITKIIRICRTHFDNVVLDLPSTLNAISFVGLYEATQIYYVLTPDALSLRAFKNANVTLERLQINNKNMAVLINRTHKKSDLTVNDIKKLISIPVVGNVPSDYFELQSYINMGKLPFDKKKRRIKLPITRSLERIIGREMKVNPK